MPTLIDTNQPDRWVTHTQDGGQSFDSDALLWGAAVVGAGGTVSGGRLALVSACISSLKSAGVWTLLDRLFLLGAENSQSALIDLVARSTATATNSPTFTTDRGYTFNGTTNFIDTTYNLSAGTQFTQNSAHILVWRRTAATQSVNSRYDGLINAAATAGTYIELGGGSGTGAAQTNPPEGMVNGPKDTANAILTASDGTGSNIINRSGAAALQSYWNGAATGTSTAASSAPINLTFWLGGRNFNTSYGQGSDAQDFAFSAGGSLTAPQALALHNAINTYKTAIGA